MDTNMEGVQEISINRAELGSINGQKDLRRRNNATTGGGAASKLFSAFLLEVRLSPSLEQQSVSPALHMVLDATIVGIL